MTDPSPSLPRWMRLWPLLALALALAWAVLIRVPLALNVANHLDSDLAVDGLTLVDLFNGNVRWHYPGTPTVGTASVLAVAPFRLLNSSNLFALAAGGITIALLGIATTFLLAWKVFGGRTAAFTLVPLAFVSTGAIWLSSRITGGHLLAVAWFALALTAFDFLRKRGGWRSAASLGLICGLGVWNDSMFLVALISMMLVGVAGWIIAGRSRSGIREAGVVTLSFLIGLLPKIAGNLADGYDAYRDTFASSWDTNVLAKHVRILTADCLPRLIAGHRLPGLQAEPGGISLDGQALPASGGRDAVGFIATALSGLLLVPSIVGLFIGKRETFAIRAVLLLTSGVVVAAFIANRNIFNSDNYRYLVFLLVPWSIGLGRLFDLISRKGSGGMALAVGLAIVYAACFALDTANWYSRLGWLASGLRPIVAARGEPFLKWLDEHPEVASLTGDYWDVYRLSLLTNGRVRGIPVGYYPNRFPEWSHGLPGGHASHVLARRTSIGNELYQNATNAGGREQYRTSNGAILDWP